MLRKLLIVSAVLVAVFSALMPLKATHVHAEDAGQIAVQKIPGETLGQKFQARAKGSWPWYLTRTSGLVAATAFVILMLSGIGQITGHTFKVLDPLTSWATHRALGIAFGISVLIHVLSLLFDHFIQFNIWQVLVPWLSAYKKTTLFGIHVGSLYVATGIISFYLVMAIVLTSLIWVDKKPHTWKIIHLISYIVVALVFVHALFVGTDLSHGFFRWLWVGLNTAVLLAAAARLRRAYTI